MNTRVPAISLGEGLAILANLGVVLGLIFVWAELRQNQAQLKADVELSLAAGYQEALGRTVENPHVAEILFKTYLEPESLTQVQYVQVMSIHAEWMALVYATWELYRSGAIDEQTWRYHSNQYLYFLSTEWTQNFWRGMLHDGMYPQEFLDEMESRMPDPNLSPYN